MSLYRLYRSLVLFVLAALLLVGCGGGADTGPYTVDATAVPQPDFALAANDADIMLTIRGPIAQTNNGAELDLTLEQLKQLRVVSYTTPDPFEGTDVTYRGVLLSDLFAAAGVASGASEVNAIATNDYAAILTIEDINSYAILLAFEANGAPIPADNKGPLRIVFPNHAHDFGVPYESQWVWQLQTLEIN